MPYGRQLIQKILAVPADIAPTDRYRVHMLYLTVTLYVAITLFLFVYALVDPPWMGDILRLNVILEGLCLMLALYHLRRRHWDTVVYLLVLPLWLLISYSSVISGGTYASTTILYVCPLILAVMLLNNRFAVLLVVLTVLYLLVLLLLEVSGVFSFPLVRTPFYRFAIMAVALGSVVGVLEYNKYKLRETEKANRQLYLETEISKIQTYYARSLAHDIRNPLAVLKTTSYVIRQYHQRGMPIDKQLDKLDAYIDKLNQIVSDSTELATLSSDHVVAQGWQPVDVNASLEGAIRTCQQVHREKQITIAVQHDTAPKAYVLGKAQYVELMFMHLIKNGLQYGKPQGKVNIRLHQTDGKICIDIEDDGIGIAEDQLTKIFEPFYRANEARTGDVYSGTGVGLAIAQRVAQLHQGSVTVHSALDQGSTFTVTLPAYTGSAAAESGP